MTGCDEELSGITDGFETVTVHSEYTYFINGAESVLCSPKESYTCLCILKVEYRINKMLNYFGSCKSSFLCDMTDEEHGDVLCLGRKTQGIAACPHLVG